MLSTQHQEALAKIEALTGELQSSRRLGRPERRRGRSRTASRLERPGPRRRPPSRRCRMPRLVPPRPMPARSTPNPASKTMQVDLAAARRPPRAGPPAEASDMVSAAAQAELEQAQARIADLERDLAKAASVPPPAASTDAVIDGDQAPSSPTSRPASSRPRSGPGGRTRPPNQPRPRCASPRSAVRSSRATPRWSKR